MENVIVVGAGPAGLAVAYHLSGLGVRYRLLDESTELASAWRRRHPQLRLNTLRQFSHQPGQRIPRGYGRWLSRDDYVRYLEEYVRRFRLNVELGHRVSSLSQTAGGWAVGTSAGTIETRHVVICTGANRVRRMPEIPGLAAFPGIVRHAEEFGPAEAYHGRRVLIVGGGNSGFDLANHLVDRPVAELTMSVRTAPSIVPREAFGLPVHALSVLGRTLPRSLQDRSLRWITRLTLGDLSSAGIGRPPEGAYTRHARDGVTVAVDNGFIRGVRRGRARIVGEVVRVEGERAITRAGEELRPEVILCATGYSPGLEPLVGHLDVLDSFGFPTTIGAQANPDRPGLWFLGVHGYIWGNMHEQRGQSVRLARAIARASHSFSAISS